MEDNDLQGEKDGVAHIQNSDPAQIKMDDEILLFCAFICMYLMVDLMSPLGSSMDLNAAKALLHLMQCMGNVACFDESINRSMGHEHRVRWAFPRQQPSFDQYLLGIYSDNMFNCRLRVSKATFNFLCSKLAPYMSRQNTVVRESISLQNRVFLALHRLAAGAKLEVLGDTYGCGKSTACGIILDFCKAVRKSGLHDMFIKWPTKSTMQTYAHEFEKFRGIPYVIGAIDVSHIPIIAPKEKHSDYLSANGFHSMLLQLTVAANGFIWDYDVGWAGSIRESVLFQRSKIGQRCENGELGPYCLVGDCAYPCRSYMLVPYKGNKEVLDDLKYHWNFIQAGTRMPVERAIGMLKGRFRILLKRLDMELKHVPDLVIACLVLHNICLVHGDAFQMHWISEVEKDLRAITMTDNARGRCARETMNEVHAVGCLTHEEEIDRAQTVGYNYVGNEDMHDSEDGMSTCDRAQNNPEARRDSIAAMLFKEHTEKNMNTMFGNDMISESGSSSMSD